MPNTREAALIGAIPADRILVMRLVDTLENLSDAAQALIQTITFTQGRTPEDEDRHGHEKWAADDLAEAAAEAYTLLNTARGS